MLSGYVKFPSIRISTFRSTGNLTGVKRLYEIPFSNKMTQSEVQDGSAARRPGVSSWSPVWGTTTVLCEETATQVYVRNKTQVVSSIFEKRKTELHVCFIPLISYPDLHSNGCLGGRVPCKLSFISIWLCGAAGLPLNVESEGGFIA